MTNNQTRNFFAVKFLRITQGLYALIGLLALNSTALAQIEPAAPGSIEYSLTSSNYTWVQTSDTITNGSYVIDLLTDRLNQPAGRGAIGIVLYTAWNPGYNQMGAMVDFGHGYSAGIVFSELSAVHVVPVAPGQIEPAAPGSIEYSLSSSNYTWFQVPGTITNGTYVVDLLTNRLNQPAGRGAIGIVSYTAWDADYNQMAAMVDFGRGYSAGIVFSELSAIDVVPVGQIEPAAPGSIEYSLTSSNYTWVQTSDTITNGSYVIDLLTDRLNQPAGRGAIGIVSYTAWDADYNQMAAMVDFGRGYSAGIVFSELSAIHVVPVAPGQIEPAAPGSIEYSLSSSNYTWFQVPGTITNGTYVVDLLTNRLNQPAGRGAIGIVSYTAWDADYNQMAAMVDFGRGYSAGIVFSELSAIDVVPVGQIEPAAPGSIEYSLTSSNYTWVQTSDTITNGSYVIDLLTDRLNQPAGRGAIGIVLYTAWDADYNQMAAMVDFGRGYSAGIVFSELSAVHVVPVAFSQSISLNEDTSKAFSLEASDVEGDVMTYSVGSPSHGVLSGTAPNLVYQPDKNYFGSDSFTFSVNDGKSESAVATVNITILPVNDPPVAKIVISPAGFFLGSANRLIIAPNGAGISLQLDGSQSRDVDNDPLTYSWKDGNSAIATNAVVTKTFKAGVHTFTLQVNDGKAVGTASETVQIVTLQNALGMLRVWLHDQKKNPGSDQRELIAALSSAIDSVNQGNIAKGSYHLADFQAKARTRLQPINPSAATKLLLATQEIINAMQKPGQLSSQSPQPKP
ncbi:cadherin-like domain-containing protein [Pedosphaera parvula]|uniref:PKD domain containing protein n=1 Tax=Pedosphaera parvula (strain Ellin514) TaxID=320771 RepID=B9XS25_PEDPL|nr:cadherin-like domain-containing protein [Pedosphaera parvula]EEF57357.1 PKD domain containing protein [Pedosphaera parvula Ellin514]